LKEGEEQVRVPIINQESGQMTLALADQRYTPDMSEEQLREGEKRSAEEQIKVRNETEWHDSITNLIQIKERADVMIHDTEPMIKEIQKLYQTGVEYQNLMPNQKDVVNRYNNAKLEISEIHTHLNTIFERGYKYGDKEEMLKISNNFRKALEDNKGAGLLGTSRAMDSLMTDLGSIEEAPQLYKPVEEFAIDESAKTFANVAMNSYKKFGNETPIISIENPPAGGGLSRGEDLKNLVESAKKQFVENATKSTRDGGLGISEREARNQANKLLGVTWDVGHINMLRKYGYSEEDIVKEAEKVAPFVKHVHLSDNFGFEHTELPMGMGNVPIKEIMEKLGKKGFEARKVIEAGNWWEHFKTSPFQQTLEAFGSPIYGIKMQPYWNQAIGNQGYFSGYGQMLPQLNYETFGSGFSMLPAELGGQRQTGRGRMGGQPME
jgi:hypothetical protein